MKTKTKKNNILKKTGLKFKRVFKKSYALLVVAILVTLAVDSWIVYEAWMDDGKDQDLFYLGIIKLISVILLTIGSFSYL